MDGQLVVLGDAWHARNPKSHPRPCVVAYRGRVSISREEIPANTSITDERWMQFVDVYTMMHRKEVK